MPIDLNLSYEYSNPNSLSFNLQNLIIRYVIMVVSTSEGNVCTQIVKFMGPTWGLPGSCRSQMGPMNLAIKVAVCVYVYAFSRNFNIEQTDVRYVNSLTPSDNPYGILELGHHWFRQWLTIIHATTWFNAELSSIWLPGPRLNIKMVFPGMGMSMIKIRQSWDSLIFVMGIPILVRTHLYIETAPRIILQWNFILNKNTNAWKNISNLVHTSMG